MLVFVGVTVEPEQPFAAKVNKARGFGRITN
jgi:hypothetical protein